ncbi:MAG: D-alanyl-D-alanine carboxypeptidase family protein [Acidimicrobiia bacterium]|nr:D-alanyl-D-alanine carboxypeptidase family protein [Acidimicrobiia bacterium]
MPLRSLSLRAAICVALTALVVLLGVGDVFAQEDEERLEELKEERERVQVEVAGVAIKVDAATADFEVVAQALDDVNGLVDLQEARLADANQAVRSAETLVDQAVRRREEINLEMADLRELVAELAVASFTGETGENGQDLTSFLLSDDPTEAMRRRSLVQFQTGNLADGLDRMRLLDAEAEQVEADRLRAVEAAVVNRTEALNRQLELDAALEAQLELVLDVEARLESRLAEAQYIQEIDAELAAEIQQQEEVIARRIREEAAKKAAAEAARRAQTRPAPADVADIVEAEGFWVHKDVQDAVTRMIQDARADGVTLSGYSYRSPQRTAELRVINGCPDVYNASPSSCRIPTARPGQSMHERGLAIDFQSCWRGSSCFTWLSNNASKYGYKNLPSESWHWSTNGR